MVPTVRSIASTALTLAVVLVSADGLSAANNTSKTGEPGGVGKIRIAEPWARATAGMATAGAAFMTLENTGAAADRLIAAESPAAANVELHTHIVEGDIMRMRAVEQIDLPAGETIQLQPGGFHVMLIGLAAPLEMGKSFPLTLRFAEAGTTTVEVPVLQPGAMESGSDHSGGDTHGHGKTEGHPPAAAGMKPKP